MRKRFSNPNDLRTVAIALAAISAFLNLYAPQAVLPLLAQEFEARAVDVSLTLTATTLAVALVAPFSGVIADVLGRKRVIAAAMFGAVVPMGVAALAPDLPTVIGCRFVQGLMLPPIFAVLIAYIGEEWPPGEATSMTGIYTAAAGFGGFLGRFLTAIVADWAGWRSAFLVDAGLTLLCAAGVAVLLPRERRFVRAADFRAALGQMLRHLGNAQLLATYAVGFGTLFNFIGVFTYVTFRLAAPPFELPPALLGSIFIVYLLGTLLTPLTGRAVARFGRRRFVLAVLVVWGCGAALTLVPSLPAIIVGLAACAACGFYCQASSTSYVATTAKQGASSAVGLYVTSFYVGGSFGAFLPGIAWAFAGWPAVVAVTIAVLFAMGLVVTAVWPAGGATQSPSA